MNSEVCHPIQQTSFPLSQEDLKKQLKRQLEFYFSAENLSNDSYMLSQMDSDNYISISTIANFNKVKNLTNDLQLVVDVLRESPYVQVEPAGLKVRSAQKQRSIVILREISQDTPVEEVEELFNGENCPPYLSCEFGLNNSWYIFFENENDAQKAYTYLREEKNTFQGKPIMARIKAKQILHSTNQHPTSNGSKPLGTSTTLPSTQQTSLELSKVSQSSTPRGNEEQLLSQPSYPNISYITHFQPATIIHNNGGIPMWQGVNSPLISVDPSMIRFTTLYDLNKNSQPAQLSQAPNEHLLHAGMQPQLHMFPVQPQANQQQILYQKQPFQQGQQLHNAYTQPQHPHLMHNILNHFVQQQPRQKIFFNHANKATQNTSNNNAAVNNKINNHPMGNIDGFKLVEPFSHPSFQNLPQFQHQQTFINPQHTQLQNSVHQPQQTQNHLKPQHITSTTTSNINDTKDNKTKFKKADMNRPDQLAKRPQNFYPPNQMFNSSIKSSNPNNFNFNLYNNFNYNNRNYNMNRNNVNMFKKPIFPKSSSYSPANISKPLIQNEPSTLTSKNFSSSLKNIPTSTTSQASTIIHVASSGFQTPVTPTNTAVTSSTTSNKTIPTSTTIEKSEQREQAAPQNEFDSNCQAENAKSKLNASNCAEEKENKTQSETKIHEGINGNNSSVNKSKKTRANIKSYQNKNNIVVRNTSDAAHEPTKGYTKTTTSTQQSSSHTSTSPAMSFQFRKHVSNNAPMLNNTNHDNNNISNNNNSSNNNINSNNNNSSHLNSNNNNNTNNANSNNSNNKSSFKAPYNNEKYKDCSNFATKKNPPARPRRGMNCFRGFRGGIRGGRVFREEANQRNVQQNKTVTKEKPSLPVETFDKSFPPLQLNKVTNGHKNDIPDQTESYHLTITNSREAIDLKDINNNNLRLSYAQIIQGTGALHSGSTDEGLGPNIHSLSLVNAPLAS